MQRKIITLLIYWTWCLPQTILGAILFLLVKISDGKAHQHFYNQFTILTESKYIFGGISLGMFIFTGSINVSDQKREYFFRHEMGHVRQSLFLGPLYLILIGVPSIIWSCLKKLGFFSNVPYGWFYTERWANFLGKTPDEWTSYRRS